MSGKACAALRIRFGPRPGVSVSATQASWSSDAGCGGRPGAGEERSSNAFIA